MSLSADDNPPGPRARRRAVTPDRRTIARAIDFWDTTRLRSVTSCQTGAACFSYAQTLRLRADRLEREA
jgi:hypothetical protein